MTTEVAGVPTAAPETGDDVLAVFAALWAMATLFHVWVSPWSQGVFTDPTSLGVGHVLLAVAALGVLLRPLSTTAIGAPAGLGLLTCWLEAPLVGNNWLLAALVDVALLLSVLAAVVGGRIDRARVAARFLPTARWSLLAFYGFAAFAKVNHAFLDPKVSCGVFYGSELTRSVHLGSLAPFGAWARLLPILVIGIEIAIPALLAVRRTRHIGVVIALTYHSVIALDTTHPFSDFSSVLLALFILLLPAAFATGLVGLRRRHADRESCAPLLSPLPPAFWSCRGADLTASPGASSSTGATWPGSAWTSPSWRW